MFAQGSKLILNFDKAKESPGGSHTNHLMLWQWSESRSGVLEPIVGILYQLHTQRCPVGSLRSAAVRLFTPQKLASTTSWLPPCSIEPIVKHLPTHLWTHFTRHSQLFGQPKPKGIKKSHPTIALQAEKQGYSVSNINDNHEIMQGPTCSFIYPFILPVCTEHFRF